MLRSGIATFCPSALAPRAFAQATGGGEPLRAINAITFGGGYSLPAWVAQRQGFFAKYGVAVNLKAFGPK